MTANKNNDKAFGSLLLSYILPLNCHIDTNPEPFCMYQDKSPPPPEGLG